MLLQQEIYIGDDRYHYARATTCTLKIERTMFGYRLDFNFTLVPFSHEKEEARVLLGWEVELYYKEQGGSVLMGRMLPHLSERSTQSMNDDFTRRRYFDLRSDDFLQLVDKSHRGDVTFEFSATPVIAEVRYAKTAQGSLVIPHSTWLEYLNKTGMDRYELIAIRVPVVSSHLHKPFVGAVAKIREAEAQYMKGDWNGAAASCRGAWRTILSSAPRNGKALEHLLAPIIGDPKRKEFAMGLIKSLHDTLNQAVHSEGDVKTDTPPTDLKPEDALLCIHWYTAVIGYLSSL